MAAAHLRTASMSRTASAPPPEIDRPPSREHASPSTKDISMPKERGWQPLSQPPCRTLFYAGRRGTFKLWKLWMECQRSISSMYRSWPSYRSGLASNLSLVCFSTPIESGPLLFGNCSCLIPVRSGCRLPWRFTQILAFFPWRRWIVSTPSFSASCDHFVHFPSSMDICCL